MNATIQRARADMQPAAAAWIRDVVLPPGYLASISNPALCPCQWGPSGYCSGDQHDQCPRTRGLERRDPQPETYIVSRRHWAALTPVWRAGGACRWLCPCSCHEEVQALFPVPPRQTGRRSNTGGNGYGRIASTDRLRVFDDPQPALLELDQVVAFHIEHVAPRADRSEA